MIVAVENENHSFGEAGTYYVGTAKVDEVEKVVVFTRSDISKAIERSKKMPDMKPPKESFFKKIFS